MRKQADTAYDFVNESASSVAGRQEGHLMEICWKKKKKKKYTTKTKNKQKKFLKKKYMRKKRIIFLNL